MSIISLNLCAECILENIQEDIATFMWGPPGIGKSQVIHQIARKLDIQKYGQINGKSLSLSDKADAQKYGGAGVEARRKWQGWNPRKQFGLCDIRLSLRDPVDLRGLPLVDAKNGTTRWLAPAELPQVDRDGEEGILFLDEANTASMAMQTAAMGLVLDRKLGEYILPKGWVPIAAGNRMLDRAAAQRMGTALRNRFAHYEVGFDLDAWVQWCNDAGMHPLLPAFGRYRTELVHKMPEGEENSFPTPRTWAMVNKLIDKPERIRQIMVAALVGDGPAAEFEAYCRMWTRLPDLDQAIKDPTRAKVPTDNEPSVFYAIASAMARRATKDNFANVITYVGRLPKEFEIVAVADSCRRDAKLKQTKAFINWSVQNQEVQI